MHAISIVRRRPMRGHLDALFEGLPLQLDADQVAEVLGVSRKAVYQWLKNGSIPGYKVGGTWIILRDELKDTMIRGSNAAIGEDGAEASAEEPPHD